jgi:hypothetical protein
MGEFSLKNRIIYGVGVTALGVLISLGPQYIFKVCEPMARGRFMTCHWTGRAEIGVGFMIAALGLLSLTFKSAKTRLGLACAVFLSGAAALSVPHILIGGCAMETMACRTTAFPALTVLSVLAMAGSALEIFYLRKANGD